METTEKDDADEQKHVVKNFSLTEDQAEWVRQYAFKERRTQADVVREAIDKMRASA